MGILEFINSYIGMYYSLCRKQAGLISSLLAGAIPTENLGSPV
jgi:hypothetical protein